MSNNTSLKAKIKGLVSPKRTKWFNASLKRLYKQVLIITAVVGFILILLCGILTPQKADTPTGILLISIAVFMYSVGFLFGIEGCNQTLNKQAAKEVDSVNDNSNPQS